MSFEGLAVLFVLCCFGVERSKESFSTLQVVVGPLLCREGEECVVKVISVALVTGGAVTFAKGGRTTLSKKRNFDSTLGYPGEDVDATPHTNVKNSPALGRATHSFVCN